ncbi:hypothetical protein Y874_09145 [Campylobacter jejuni CVM 41936]|nr:hypothetical protein K774_09205 [Campylobacter jejuni CVM 41973]KQI44157.1 hypothetical protein Y874_09145 [Campylobacter jejuni CVM 41936]
MLEKLQGRKFDMSKILSLILAKTSNLFLKIKMINLSLKLFKIIVSKVKKGLLGRGFVDGYFLA